MQKFSFVQKLGRMSSCLMCKAGCTTSESDGENWTRFLVFAEGHGVPPLDEDGRLGSWSTSRGHFSPRIPESFLDWRVPEMIDSTISHSLGWFASTVVAVVGVLCLIANVNCTCDDSLCNGCRLKQASCSACTVQAWLKALYRFSAAPLTVRNFSILRFVAILGRERDFRS